MHDVLRNSELLEGLAPELLSGLTTIMHSHTVPKDEYLFLLGDHADRLHVVLEGKVEVCFPLSIGGAVKDIAVETIGPGGAVGLSALVRPYRFTLSGRAAARSELATFLRSELQQVLDGNPPLACAFMTRLTEVLGRRFLTMQALWHREVQRAISSGRPVASASEKRA